MFSILLDFETRSRLSLTKPNDVGAWRYSEHESTEILCAGYLVRGENGELLEKGVWTRGDHNPPGFLKYMKGEYVIKAFNAPFEIAIWNNVAVKKLGWQEVPLNKWECLMSRALVQALPGNLNDLGNALDLTTKKDMEGHKLMMSMCKPLSQRGKKKADGVIEWREDAESLKWLAEYCMVDVETEDLVDQYLRPLLAKERQLWLLDQRINQRGFRVDIKSAEAAAEMIDEETVRYNSELIELTNGTITKPTQTMRIKKWVNERGAGLPDLRAETLEDALLENTVQSKDAKRLLEIRLLSNSISVQKIKAMLRMYTADGSVKYNTIHHKAKTGRWAGTGIQPHNFPRAKVENRELFFKLLNQRDFDCIEFMFGERMKTLSACLRNFVIPREGYKFLIGDFSSVESMVLNHTAGAQKKLDLYKKKEDVYKHTATIIYHKPVCSISKKERAIGKVAELFLGYQGSVGPFTQQAKKAGFIVTEDFALSVVRTWRKANPEIVQLWYDTERAATTAVQTGKVQICNGIKWGTWKDFLCAKLPSGRYLYYCKPKVEKQGRYYKLSIMDKVQKWSRQPTYGGRLVENIIQAICRDLLVDAMLRLDAKGYNQVFTVHDETIAEVRIDDETKPLEEFLSLLSMRPKWAKDYPISAGGWEDTRYSKD